MLCGRRCFRSLQDGAGLDVVPRLSRLMFSKGIYVCGNASETEAKNVYIGQYHTEV